ncbi:hypothetical protein AOQ84DRAFT_375096 [Glonium stellatum]|uniref:Uncharacterized protein n=1 Tax=Glonium stellatum TaxID=574774 RepID=A0A8E2JV13_9PEZI|nr:hypothetical protein AOQ84DRAFT_375096 [Glonium stellatum]
MLLLPPAINNSSNTTYKLDNHQLLNNLNNISYLDTIPMTDQKNPHSHAGCRMGHVRAQRFAMDSHYDDLFEKEKAAIKSYEDGWDDWDGPIWPWRETNHSQTQQKLENEYQGCCNADAGVGVPAHSTTEKLQPCSKSSSPALSTSSNDPVSPHSPLWGSRTTSHCPNCGRVTSPAHL